MEKATSSAKRAAAFSEQFFGDTPDARALRAELRSERFEDCPIPLAPLIHNVLVDVESALSASVRAEIAAARRSHTVLRINDELTTAITNSVHCTTLVDTLTGQPYKLSLPMLARALAPIGAQYTMQRFAKLVIRYGPSTHTTHLCFTSGKVLEPGKVEFETKRLLLYALVNMMRAAGLANIGVGVRACQNLVSTGMLTFGVRLRLLKLKFSEGNHVMYDPDLFPGAIIRHPLLIDVFTESINVVEDTDDTEGGEATPYTYPGPRDCDADEVLDNPDAERSATEYARALLARLEPGSNDPQRVAYMANEVLTAQANKNIVGLVFSIGCMILGGAKNVRMLRRASALVFEMASACRDTPENRALEADLLRAKGLPVIPDSVPSSGATQKRGRKRGASAGSTGRARPAKKARGDSKIRAEE